MDWARAIERNSEALRGIVALLFVMLDGLADRVPLSLHRAVTRVLVPAESAVRRLIVIVARGLEAKPSRSRPMAKLPASKRGRNRLAFRLFDRRKRAVVLTHNAGSDPVPRIHVFGADPRIALFQPKPPPVAGAGRRPDDGLMDARRLRLRLEAVSRALGDLPRQARRLARWRVRRETNPRLRFMAPLRPGPPPGHRRTALHPVDRILSECHGLAHHALAPDTS